jgi:SAM-dependent methyltransferase
MEEMYYKSNVEKYYADVGNHILVSDQSFSDYLRAQLEETLSKKKLFNKMKIAAFPLLDTLKQHTSLAGMQVLCVGARNGDEIDLFQASGASAIGIDLYSDRPDIAVMDMHDLKYADSSFDIVYSNHSFEHAYDKERAAREFQRVVKSGGYIAIEVPGNYLGGADVNQFAGPPRDHASAEIANVITAHRAAIILKTIAFRAMADPAGDQTCRVQSLLYRIRGRSSCI